MTTRTLPLVLEGDRARTDGLALVQPLSARTRFWRAFWPAAAGLGLALGSLFFAWAGPIVALAFAFCGTALATRAYRHGSVLTAGGGPCPECGGRIQVERGPQHWPLDMSCPHCRAELTVHPLVGSARAQVRRTPGLGSVPSSFQK